MAAERDSEPGEGQKANLVDVLQSVAKGLSDHPLLLAGFGAVIAIVVAAEMLDGAFLAAGTMIIVILVLSFAGWLLSRRYESRVAPVGAPGTTAPGTTAPSATPSTIDVDRSRDVRMRKVGNLNGPAAPDVRAGVRVKKSRRVVLEDVGNTDVDSPGREG